MRRRLAPFCIAVLMLTGIWAGDIGHVPAPLAVAHTESSPSRPQAQTVWTPVYPPARSNAALAYDSVRAETILFGGSVDNHQDSGLNDTWRYDGNAWQPVPTTTQPPPNRAPLLAYDSLRQRVVLFGGMSNTSAAFSDTWEFDGQNWIHMVPAATPPARYGHSLVYDPQLQKVVLFGGQHLSTYYSDTWTYDGLTWTQLAPSQSPFARTGIGLAYDSMRQRLVLFGGANGSTYYNDTWEFDGSTWTERLNTTPPSNRAMGLTYDSTRQRIVGFGGATGAGPTLLDETWEFDGNTWQQMTPSTVPRARVTGGSLVYDSRRQRVVMFGNWCGHNDGGCRLADTWEYDGVNWELGVDLTYPFHRRFGHAMAYDPLRQVSIMFGGWKDGLSYTDETWVFDGAAWQSLSPSSRPSGRDSFRLAFDPIRGRTVLFGGNVVGYRDDTWEWDGANWISQNPAQKPSARHSYAMAYSASLGGVVLFGGETNGVVRTNDTWLYTGTTWIELAPPVRPPGRSAHNMVYDSQRDRLVMFGGVTTTTFYSDTWEFDGLTWLPVTPTVSPPARAGFAMAYDSDRNVTVLFGGGSMAGTQLADVWEYDGLTWTSRATTLIPMGRSAAAMTYDSGIGQVVLAGGLYSGADTWLYGPAAAPTSQAVFMPAVLMNYQRFFTGPHEVEDNDSAAQANGPLRSAQDYLGYPNDDNDYYSLHSFQTGTMVIDLSNVSGQGTQLQVFYEDTGQLVGFDATFPFHLNLPDRPAGWYYVRVYTAAGHNDSAPYTLRVTYP